MKEYQVDLQTEDTFITNLRADLDSILRTELRNKGYDPDIISDQTDLAIAYASIKARRIESKPRHVHINPVLFVPSELQTGFDQLVEKIKSGQNVNTHLSRLLAKVDSIDLLFYDWGINHMHLGTVIESDGFVNRTDPVAFIIVRNDDVYIISIAEHGSWTDVGMLEIIDSNWPELVERNKIDGRFEPSFDVVDLKKLRKAHINMGISLPNGHSYVAIGGGYASSGVSTLAVLEYNKLIHSFKNIYKLLNGNLRLVADDDYVSKYGTVVEIRMRLEDNELWLYVPNMNREFMFTKFSPLPE